MGAFREEEMERLKKAKVLASQGREMIWVGDMSEKLEINLEAGSINVDNRIHAISVDKKFKGEK